MAPLAPPGSATDITPGGLYQYQGGTPSSDTWLIVSVSNAVGVMPLVVTLEDWLL